MLLGNASAWLPKALATLFVARIVRNLSIADLGGAPAFLTEGGQTVAEELQISRSSFLGSVECSIGPKITLQS